MSGKKNEYQFCANYESPDTRFPQRILTLIITGMSTAFLGICMFTLQRIEARIDKIETIESTKWEDLAVVKEQMIETRDAVAQLRDDMNGAVMVDASELKQGNTFKIKRRK